MNVLQSRIGRAFSLTGDLVAHVSDEDLRLGLPDLPSNLIGEQLWVCSWSKGELLTCHRGR